MGPGAVHRPTGDTCFPVSGLVWHTAPVRQPIRVLLALVALQIPWMARPVNYDEANFLTLARGAAEDPWRPHVVSINWQGITEPAFDVLSNPPGIAWWLAPVVSLPVWAQRAWMLPWLGLALLGAVRLGRRFLDDGESGALLLLTAPIVLLSTTALLPDLPLYACTLLGIGGFVDATDKGQRAWPWALLAGAAALFRYSGITLLPLLALYAFRRGRAPWSALAAAVPFLLLAAHDLSAYGAWHFLAMTAFQSVANTSADHAHKLAAALAMLGGAAALPVFRWTRGIAVGGVVGAIVGAPYGWVGAAFAAAGGASLAAIAARRNDRAFLGAWVGGGVLFLLALRFVATRYWLPFLPGVLLALPLGSQVRRLVLVHTCLGVLLLADDHFSAQGVTRLAREAAGLGVGRFTGHWGWQHTLEAAGWTALDAGSRAQPGERVAMPRQAWPQGVDVPCSKVVWEGVASPPFPWLPRAYSERGGANLHADWIAGPPPVRTILPWTFADDPYERARVCQD